MGTSSDGGSIDRDINSPPTCSPRSSAIGVGDKVGALDFGNDSQHGSQANRKRPSQKRLKKDKSLKMGAKAKKDLLEDMKRRLDDAITRDEWNKFNKEVQ